MSGVPDPWRFGKLEIFAKVIFVRESHCHISPSRTAEAPGGERKE
jgi:hypothetical protein